MLIDLMKLGLNIPISVIRFESWVSQRDLGLMHDIKMLLLFEPGTNWTYGVSQYFHTSKSQGQMTINGIHFLVC